MGMMINCATLSRRLMDRIHWRTEAGVVLSTGFLGRVAAIASGMHSPRAMQARSRLDADQALDPLSEFIGRIRIFGIRQNDDRGFQVR
jgi:hypothetical protein